ncbi:Uu.00g064430.m01.CDS01 [Anthostomella pinea]|uniref:Uu.00g064430.m01.CDS01 n=1 Tax=Anthostomella pinea TaxID=933095 RepID=A0AAI8YN26_9PEZI|nr:Uu.00g064430.m01.CDS01 [Anthostomella pinea]
MAARLSVPTTARLPSSLRVSPSNPAVLRVLNRLSRPSLLSLVLDWLDPKNQRLCPPVLRPPPENPDDPEDDDDDDDDDDDEFFDDLYPPARSLAKLQETYEDMQTRKGSRREVVDRVLEGDWRHGISLYQLAMADQQYLYDHPGSLKWACYKIAKLQTPDHEDMADDDDAPEKLDRETLAVPRFHPPTFLQNLQAEVLPDVKAHYNFDRPRGGRQPLLLLRIFVLESPYNTELAVTSAAGSAAVNRPGIGKTTTTFDVSRTIYIAFPDDSPHVFVSKPQSTGAGGSATAGETRSLRALVVEGVPKALSRPRERYALRATNLETKNLDAMLAVKGAGRTNAAQGGWSIYAAGDKAEGAVVANDSPLNALLPTPPLSVIVEEDKDEKGDTTLEASVEVRQQEAKKRKRPLDPEEAKEGKERKRSKLVAQARFGDSAQIDDGKGIERFDIRIEDPFPGLLPVEEDNEDEREADGHDEARGRKKSNKGRKNNVDASLLQEEDPDEDEEQRIPDNSTRDETARGGDKQHSSEGTNNKWRPIVRLTFHGPHVFAGVRQLVEAGVIDSARMPGWMTGEEGVSVGAVRHGRIRGHKGSGM